MAKQKVFKNQPTPKPLDALVDRAAEATVARFTAARAQAEVPGVTQGEGSRGPRVVGAPVVGGLGDLSPAAVRKLAAAFIRNGLEMAVKFGGGAFEDLAEAQRETLAEFIPDAAYRFVEDLMHKMHGGEPHVVSGPQGSPPSPAA